ncbi:putative peptide zinc metalloprotease protein [Hoeflea halophila]|uniref:Putative peptide zinc metalloprotease protein n=1 Tax=Hoeflea halophila TaxID=714899 RepID=A0A286IFX0_9HYPH|nr:site-2 protease family protein [Hoeflea halophila]SOE19043.1 putative peptide zinc metalloprotease protein [Hoeflea halophila]
MAGRLIQAGAGALPQLRTDIEWVERTDGQDGVRYWQVHDPVQHRFFRIDEDTKRILSVWNSGSTSEQLTTKVRTEFGIDLSPSSIQKLVQFLEASNLLSLSQDGSWHSLRKKKNGLAKLNSGQIFGRLIMLKLPLANPEPLLQLLRHLTALVFTQKFTLLMAVVAVAGLYLSASEMLALISTSFADISIRGLFHVGLALVILKTCHELGHAVTAYRFGCRVPTFGVAFMAFVPLLYTDVSDSWRLRSKKQKLLISAAGMIAEVYLAAIATLLWAFLNEGLTRDIAFYIATVGWISSLGFNLNPLAKFDGYYLLSDLIGFENLQSRATEISLWKLRQVLIAPDLQPPAEYSRRKRTVLIVYAVLSWIYRLGIFVGIALLFYNYTAKVFGFVLFFLTVFYLVFLPIWRELKVWRRLKLQHPISGVLRRPVLVLICLVGGFSLPLFGQVYSPAVLIDSELQRVYPPENARLSAVHVQQSDFVRAGDPIVDFEVPQLQAEILKNSIELEAARRQLARALSSQTDRSSTALLRHEIEALERRGRDLSLQVGELRIVGRLDGHVVQVSKEMRPGNWVSRNRWVVLVSSGREQVTHGYLSEEDLEKVTIDTRGVFIPDDPTRAAIPLVVSRIASDATQELELPELSSQFGGAIRTHTEKGKELVPIHPIFHVEFRIVGKAHAVNQLIRGTAVLNGRRESLAIILWRRITKVLIKESVI